MFVQSANNSSRPNYIIKPALLTAVHVHLLCTLSRKLYDYSEYLLEKRSLNLRHGILTCATCELYWLVSREVASEHRFKDNPVI